MLSGATTSPPASVLKDLFASVAAWRLWTFLAWDDLAKQYRRTFVGPLWLALNTAILIGAFGLIWSQVFGHPIDEYLPYVALGHVAFIFMSAAIMESCHGFIQAEAFIRQVPLPKLIFPLRVLLRNLFVLAHNLPTAVIALLFFDRGVLAGIPLSLLGLTLSCVFLVSIGTALACLCVRFRDIPSVVANTMQVAFFLSPVLWRVERLPESYTWIVDFNPFAHFLRLMRDPLLEGTVAPHVIYSALLSTVIAVVIAALAFAVSRRRIVYWL